MGISVRSPVEPAYPQEKPSWREGLSSQCVSHQHGGATGKATTGSGGTSAVRAAGQERGEQTTLEILLWAWYLQGGRARDRGIPHHVRRCWINRCSSRGKNRRGTRCCEVPAGGRWASGTSCSRSPFPPHGVRSVFALRSSGDVVCMARQTLPVGDPLPFHRGW